MGRHSAPDDPDDTPLGATAVAVRERDEIVGPRGRHARPDDESDLATLEELIDAGDRDTVVEAVPDDSITQRMSPVLDEATSPTVRPPPVAPPSHTVLRGAAQNSAADLQLARSHRGVLAACAAAVVLPFVVEIVVLVVLGTVDGHSILVWLWAPLVVAGVLLGVTLDIAHRRHSAINAVSAVSAG